MELTEHISKSCSDLEKSDAGYTRTYIFKESFPGFDGHFPGNPILPGVIQTMLGQTSSMEALKREFPAEKLSLQSITRCKFLRPIRPMEKLELKLSIKTKGLNHISICSLAVKGDTAATYQLIFAPEGL
ncbi:3-hydroxyacyl-ACP dehydratase FabZ family protein [Desulfovibrio sp. JC010]|uniref:3-hydroxyacyl-ACP dehydratase FabZ family protein n=1 Tax=Desulfovibrio sp. JC010 TaxID=2593641 RepID=UPI0013D43DD2|nr:3-hydroxyacyl-ACP dehydratase [Desulfovibrio sp. JC010]NDV26734.1 3-hydroxyacyl-ACP dehydratase [Desulfovibrio sp. JC010]